MPLAPVPEPYDFALSTERFRAFGIDRSTLWHEGGLHRVIGGREVRIEPAPGGVAVEPLDAADRSRGALAARAGLRSACVRGLGRTPSRS